MGKVASAVITACLIVAVFHVFFDIAYVSGNSMEPVFYEGDILLLRKWGMPQKGDMVAAYIEELDYDVVKRILASEGDRVTTAYEGLFLNGEMVAESVKGIQEERKKQERQEFILPPDQYFLIGENQEVSLDSRVFGCIGKSAVRGIVVCKLF
ncbi:signal peptidase I [Schaedlerella arabinosiphila]|jgi:signal peptidase I|uniref:signal peptidase I n=1 Tax=Schaedlerella arabinosiphila TaxID=2044587 RepID=UPI001FA9EA6C|nr:signal peptidase I [Schaedlerella arabinosiphila]